MKEPSRGEEAILAQALTRPEGARAAFLDQTCGKDDELRRRLEGLLQEHARASAAEQKTEIAGPAGEANARADSAGETAERIGPYKLLQKLGEGGWGEVFMAEQEKPVRRRVALKIIKLGMDSKTVIARFEAERQALAMMDHPNIARVFDAGTTGTGRPYFVMELVRGVKITDYCDTHNLPTADRLELFIQVCHAIQHAHQKGIIHRDIKPGNVLVAVNDGAPLPKVIDFGIAKATDVRLTDKTLVTMFDQFIGTPVYMSPEQAEMSALDVDTRTDIYSLGVLLYELLTGLTPFEGTELQSAGFDEMRRIIREKEPATPSTRLSTMEGKKLSAMAQRRKTEAPGLIHLLKGDLDWIVMKALEKDRQRRYQTANDLAADVQRHLHDEAVLARPPSRIYKFKKYARRNRAAFAAVAAVFIALVAGLVFSLIGFRRAVVARQEAERQRAVAMQARAESEGVTTFLTDMLAAANPMQFGKDVPVRAVLDQAAENVAKNFVDRPLVEARLRETIGRTYLELGVMDLAEKHLAAAIKIRTEQLGLDHELTLRSRTLQVWVGVNREGPAKAEKALREILVVYEQDPSKYAPLDLGVARRLFAQSLAGQGRLDEAIGIQEKNVAALSSAVGPWHLETMRARNLLAGYTLEIGEYYQSRAMYAELIAHCDLPREHPLRLGLVQNAGIGAMLNGYYKEAEAIAREMVESSRRILGETHGETMRVEVFLGIAVGRQGRLEEGIAILEKCLNFHLRVLGEESLSTNVDRHQLAVLYSRAGRSEEALPMISIAVKRLRDRLGNGRLYYSALADYATVELVAGNLGEAERICRELMANLAAGKHPYEYIAAKNRVTLANALAGQKRFAEAEQVLLENHARLSQLTYDVRPHLYRCAEALIVLYNEWQKPTQAAAWRAKLGPPPEAGL